MEKLRIGISSCLLGNNVRYDGGHKRDNYLINILGKYVEYVPVCPEVECGLPIPREAMRLVGEIENPRLVTRTTNVDLTEQMLTWARKRVKELEKENLCGFIFQKSSPSSGMERIKVYNKHGMGEKKGIGMFAREFMNHFPFLPVEDDGRMHDHFLRENFIQRIFVKHRWLELIKSDKTVNGLVKFHTQHKLLLMSHSQKYLKEMGKIVASINKKNMKESFDAYHLLLMDTVKLKSTAKKNVNVLQHIQGYFKKQISKDEKQELVDIIQNYYDHLVPLIVPITLLNHYIRKYNIDYLQDQIYLNPHPAELALRNHV
jgi:uncharacterized protein YbgA (DUF1722 family)/uncharacterized protein YbbK (DUF523 family)